MKKIKLLTSIAASTLVLFTTSAFATAWHCRAKNGAGVTFWSKKYTRKARCD